MVSDHGVTGEVLGWREVNLPTYDFGSSLVYLKCQFAHLSNGEYMLFQQTVKDKMKTHSTCWC